MGQSLTEKRPWLAALLAVLVTGLGHLYLRRVRRAVGWLVGLLAASLLFVDPSVVTAAGASPSERLYEAVPLLFVVVLNAFDAYLLAHAHNAYAQWLAAVSDGTHCPNCGKELEPGLDFCHWCTTELD